MLFLGMPTSLVAVFLFFLSIIVLIIPGFFDLPLHFKKPGFFMAADLKKTSLTVWKELKLRCISCILIMYRVKSGIMG